MCYEVSGAMSEPKYRWAIIAMFALCPILEPSGMARKLTKAPSRARQEKWRFSSRRVRAKNIRAISTANTTATVPVFVRPSWKLATQVWHRLEGDLAPSWDRSTVVVLGRRHTSLRLRCTAASYSTRRMKKNTKGFCLQHMGNLG